ncbi:unnamed protein product [Vicia faba]|uniref:ABC1 atypical kinase-like domain-containing protein n=1 Tax=Vicia faba TaxID=3906 RepID=A0AAV1ABD6_VICFA|nr:unnamed protein product [Vicia faba]
MGCNSTDLFPRDLCGELAEFQTNAPSHSFSYSRKCIENAFGRNLNEIFEKFEEEPVASGSIAQVHRATLKYKYPGQQIKKLVVVAVKVRHPGVTEAIRRDFFIINLVSKISWKRHIMIVTTLVLEGWQRRLDPDYDMLHALRTLLFKADWAEESLAYAIQGPVAP